MVKYGKYGKVDRASTKRRLSVSRVAATIPVCLYGANVSERTDEFATVFEFAFATRPEPRESLPSMISFHEDDDLDAPGDRERVGMRDACDAHVKRKDEWNGKHMKRDTKTSYEYSLVYVALCES